MKPLIFGMKKGWNVTSLPGKLRCKKLKKSDKRQISKSRLLITVPCASLILDAVHYQIICQIAMPTVEDVHNHAVGNMIYLKWTIAVIKIHYLQGSLQRIFQ